MSLTNGTFYSSNVKQRFIELPDGRMAIKWSVKPTGETQYSYQIVASSDQGETWTILDSDLDATYQYSSGHAYRNANTSSSLAMWATNGVVFNCVGLKEVESDDSLDQRHSKSNNFALFYTTDISSGVWTAAAKSASKSLFAYGFYNPNDQIYYATTSAYQVMCSLPGSLDSDGWRFLDKAGYHGINSSQVPQYDITLFDERNNRLVFYHAGTYTFDYYTFKSTIKGVGADEYQNRLVTFEDLDGYLKAPVLSRTGATPTASTKLAFTSTRQAAYGRNYAVLSHDQLNAAHQYLMVGENVNNAVPKVGQLGMFTGHYGNDRLPTVGRGPNGWVGLHLKNLQGHWAIGGDSFGTKNYGTDEEHLIESPGALYLSGTSTVNGSTNGANMPYVVIPFTKFSVKRYNIWFDYDRSKLLFPARWENSSSTSYPLYWSEAAGKKYYLYHVTGIPFNWHNYNHKGTTGYNQRPTLDYLD